MKNPFKKSSAIDTLTNVGIGGAANVAIDYAVSQVEMLATADPMYVNIGKIAVGALGGSMVKNKYARAAMDGVATVGVSNLIASLISDTTAGSESTNGLAKGTISQRMIPGNRRYIRNRAAVKGAYGIGAAAKTFVGK